MRPGASLPILFVDDEEGNLRAFKLQFGDLFDVRYASSGAEALTCLEKEDVAAVLTDERMPGMCGIDLLAQVEKRWPDVVRIIVSAYADASRLLAAMNRGHAHEYVLKPWSEPDLRASIERALVLAERRRALAVAAERAEVLEGDARSARSGDADQKICGLEDVLALARRAAESDATVLIRGETGTGKELLAQAIHDASPRAGGPFVRVNCGALSEGVLESELFGHEAGAFTGAQKRRRGRFELASGGTLFLDEVGDVSPKLQVSLLRVLQEKELERVGGSETVRVDVRIVAATHRDLEARVESGAFRQDLFYRLNVVPLWVPPLRARLEAMPALVEHLLAKLGRKPSAPRTVSPEVLSALQAYAWPGNVRELENVLHRALILADGEIALEHLNLTFVAPREAPASGGAHGVRDEVREKEARELRDVLLRNGGNLSKAAVELGVPRTTLLSRAKKHALL